MAEEPRERIVNFDPLWSATPRVYRIGDVSLGRRGLPQQVLVYLLAGLLGAVGILLLPLVGSLIAAVVPGVVWVVGVTAFVGALGAWRPGGVPVHILGPVLVRFLFRDRVLLGWVPLPDPCRPWQPDDLVMQDDGSHPSFTAMEFRGPGLLVRARPAVRGRTPRRLRDRLLRRPPGEWMREQPGAELTEPRVTTVPPGVRVQIRPNDR